MLTFEEKLAIIESFPELEEKMCLWGELIFITKTVHQIKRM